MPTNKVTPTRKEQDISELAFSIVEELTSGQPFIEDRPIKNPAAVARGKLGGAKGGRARAERLPAKKRKAIAKKAAETRWRKKLS